MAGGGLFRWPSCCGFIACSSGTTSPIPARKKCFTTSPMRAFAGLELGRDAIPDETTILNFRHLLERHELTKAVFAAVSKLLEARGALLRGGTIVDATLIAASPSTKNEAQKRDPEMRSSKKGNQWYFGMKAHIGVDAKSGLVHTAGVTTGSVHDAKVMDYLIREDDRAVYGDKGYANDRKQRQAEAAGVLWAVKAKAKPGCPLSISQRRRNRRFGKIRAKVGHVFRVMKCQFGYRKVRYRGIVRTARRSLRCSRSPTYSLPAGHSRPHDEDGGESLPAEARNNAGTSINDENSAPTSTHCEKLTLLRGSLTIC